MHNRKKSVGFTLIELLVVIGVIAILAAILFPVFARVREKGRQIACASNEHQLGLAFLQYINDYDEVLPSAAMGGPNGTTVAGGWMYYSSYPADDPIVGPTKNAFDPTRSSLYSYIKSRQVYTCPDDIHGQLTGDSYAYNSCLTSPSLAIIEPAGILWPGKAIASVDAPSNVLLLAEEGVLDTDLSTNDGLFNMTNVLVGQPGYDYNQYSGRHTEGSNILLLDGHVIHRPYNSMVAENLPTGGVGDYCTK